MMYFPSEMLLKPKGNKEIMREEASHGANFRRNE